jgi:flagellar hook-length control protein FliK
MVSAHSHVRAALEAALPVLRTSLAENGIQLSQSSVSSESFSASSSLITAATAGFAFRPAGRL